MGAGLAALLGGTSYTYLGGGLGGEGARAVVQMWSPMAEISTLMPQLEHLIEGKRPGSMVKR